MGDIDADTLWNAYTRTDLPMRVWMFARDMFPEVEAYVLQGKRPNNFVQAVFANDLRAAILLAQHMPVPLLTWFVLFVRGSTPIDCNGSRAKVAAWVARGGLEGATMTKNDGPILILGQGAYADRPEYHADGERLCRAEAIADQLYADGERLALAREIANRPEEHPDEMGTVADGVLADLSQGTCPETLVIQRIEHIERRMDFGLKFDREVREFCATTTGAMKAMRDCMDLIAAKVGRLENRTDGTTETGVAAATVAEDTQRARTSGCPGCAACTPEPHDGVRAASGRNEDQASG